MARDINQIMQELDSYYAPSINSNQQQLNELPAYYTAQQQGLDQTKTNAFSDITAGANSRGVLYSGIPIGEQAKYVGGTYLPAVAALKQDQNQRTSTLQDSIAKIRQQQSQQAYGIRNDELQLDQQRAADAQRLAQARVSSGGRSGGGSSRGPSAAQLRQEDISGLEAALRGGNKQIQTSGVGKDGYVSPASYANGKAAWVGGGYSAKDYDTIFGKYRNPKNKYYKLG